MEEMGFFSVKMALNHVIFEGFVDNQVEIETQQGIEISHKSNDSIFVLKKLQKLGLVLLLTLL